MSGKLIIPLANETQAAAVKSVIQALASAYYVEDKEAVPVPPPPAPAPVPAPDIVGKYTDPMLMGMQVVNYMEHAWAPAGYANEPTQADYDRMALLGDNIRVPFNMSARADESGIIPKADLDNFVKHCSMAIQAFVSAKKPPRVIADPEHHNYPRKGNNAYSNNFAAGKLINFTQAQHDERSLAMWKQVAEAVKDLHLGLSLDNINEPDGAITLRGMNAWNAKLVAMIRATGGKNAERFIWLESLNGQIRGIEIPPGGNIGLSPHNYQTMGFTHGNDALSPYVLTDFYGAALLDVAYAKAKGVPMSYGECGAIPKADRPEYLAFLRSVFADLGVSGTVWGYGSDFANFDKAKGDWYPGTVDAFAGKIKVRDYGKPILGNCDGVRQTDYRRTGTKTEGDRIYLPPSDGNGWQYLFTLPNMPAGSMSRIILTRVDPLDAPDTIGIEPSPRMPTGNGTDRAAKRVSDGSEIGAGYRPLWGQTIEYGAMEPGAVAGFRVEQVGRLGAHQGGWYTVAGWYRP